MSNGAILYLLLVDITCLISGTYLVATGHYGWAWIPLVIIYLTQQIP